MTRIAALLALLLLSACAAVPPVPQPEPDGEPSALTQAEIRRQADAAARQFIEVVSTVEPVAEAECRKRRPQGPCDFQIVIDDRYGQPPNAFHTVARDGQPLLAFNLALILAVRNADELAFIMGHEAAHHIAGHVERARAKAALGAQALGGVAEMAGGDDAAIRAGLELGAALGRRSFTKTFELEADALGTVIAFRAGYDPVRGAEFFGRIPDPGNRFLGTHPPNAARIETVRRVAEAL
ncbi:MAG: peptidase M48 [Rhodobacteraceae bacterium]|nr:MAG: peptidase M48 [Paracoccaceae bacterium]